MIHTIRFSTVPVCGDREYILNEFRAVRDKNERLVYVKKYKDLNMRYDIEYGRLLVTINLNKLLNKNSIIDSDNAYVVYKYGTQFYELFDEATELGTLNRIDYKADIVTEYKEVYIKLMKKTVLKYKSLTQNSKYKTSIYFNSKSANINIYDKEQELKDKGNEVLLSAYKDIIRFEVQLKRDKLYYMERRYGIIREELINYFSAMERDYYLLSTLRPIIYKGDYFSISKSREILKSKYSNSMSEKLINFQKSISKYGVSKTKENYSYSTFRNYIKKLEKANINPIPIPKHEGIKYLPNLFDFNKLDISEDYELAS